MKIISLSQARRFIQDESGVYTVMGGLLALPILALIFVSLESAGIIQDQARLSDSLEQAVLSLTAENNSGRKDNDYKLSGSSNKENDSFDISSEVGKRDSQMATKFVKAFLPQTNEEKMHLTPVCKTINNTNGKGHTSSSEVTCTVSGTIEHKSWFPLKVGTVEVIPHEVNVASKSKAFKKNTFNIPIDLMVVADLSVSMRYDITNKYETNNETSKLGILKDVLIELAEKTLLSEDANQHNRIYVTPFALGAEIDASSCALPYHWDKGKDPDTPLKIKNILSKKEGNNQQSRAEFIDNFVYKMNTQATLDNIGEKQNYKVTFPKGVFCLKNMKNKNHGWFSRKDKSDFTGYVRSLRADGATLASSGVLVAANNMIKGGSRTKELKEQTKRVILVLSDGNDEIVKGDPNSKVPFLNYTRITENLIYGRQEEFLSGKKKVSFGNTTIETYLTDTQPKEVTNGMCNVIRDKLDKLNNDKNTKIVFVEFGYASKSKEAWKHCVEGDKNYYSANDKASLLNSFKQAIGETDDVGRSIN